MKPIKNDKIEPKMELGSATKQKSQEKARYSRYDQERFQVNPVTELQIDTALSFHGVLCYFLGPKIAVCVQKGNIGFLTQTAIFEHINNILDSYNDFFRKNFQRHS